MARKKEINYVTDPEGFKKKFSEWPDFTLMPKDFIFFHILKYLYDCGVRSLCPVDVRNLVVYSKLKRIESNLSLSEKVCREYFEKATVFGDDWENVSVDFLGDDVYRLSGFDRDSVRRSISYLLSYYKIDLSPVKANDFLVEWGYLENIEVSGDGKPKKFRSLTTKGLKYGVNIQHPDYQGVAQPYYSISSFFELANLLKAAS